MLVEAAGLELLQLRPGIDGIALITRAYEGRRPEHGQWWSQESPLNAEIERTAAEQDARPARVNHRKLEVCGQFCFRVRKPLDWQPARGGSSPTWREVRGQSLRLAGDARRLLVEQVRQASRSPQLRAAAGRVPGARRAVRAVRRQRAARSAQG